VAGRTIIPGREKGGAVNFRRIYLAVHRGHATLSANILALLLFAPLAAVTPDGEDAVVEGDLDGP
jgi:hypothetical protein